LTKKAWGKKEGKVEGSGVISTEEGERKKRKKKLRSDA
jgi:hypothetical protein